MNNLKIFVTRTLIASRLKEWDNPSAYLISLVERDVMDEVDEWTEGDMKEWLSYNCGLDLDDGDVLPELED